jgi:hypothetical protein
MGDGRKLHIEELHSSYSSPSIITVIKLRKAKLAGNVARIGANRNAYRMLVRGPEENYN